MQCGPKLNLISHISYAISHASYAIIATTSLVISLNVDFQSLTLSFAHHL